MSAYGCSCLLGALLAMTAYGCFWANMLLVPAHGWEAAISKHKGAEAAISRIRMHNWLLMAACACLLLL